MQTSCSKISDNLTNFLWDSVILGPNGQGRYFQSQVMRSYWVTRKFVKLSKYSCLLASCYWISSRLVFALFIQIIFLVKSFLGKFYRHLAIFIWSHYSPCIGFESYLWQICVFRKFLYHRVWEEITHYIVPHNLGHNIPIVPSATKLFQLAILFLSGLQSWNVFSNNK